MVSSNGQTSDCVAFDDKDLNSPKGLADKICQGSAVGEAHRHGFFVVGAHENSTVTRRGSHVDLTLDGFGWSKFHVADNSRDRSPHPRELHLSDTFGSRTSDGNQSTYSAWFAHPDANSNEQTCPGVPSGYPNAQATADRLPGCSDKYWLYLSGRSPSPVPKSQPSARKRIAHSVQRERNISVHRDPRDALILGRTEVHTSRSSSQGCGATASSPRATAQGREHALRMPALRKKRAEDLAFETGTDFGKDQEIARLRAQANNLDAEVMRLRQELEHQRKSDKRCDRKSPRVLSDISGQKSEKPASNGLNCIQVNEEAVPERCYNWKSPRSASQVSKQSADKPQSNALNNAEGNAPTKIGDEVISRQEVELERKGKREKSNGRSASEQGRHYKRAERLQTKVERQNLQLAANGNGNVNSQNNGTRIPASELLEGFKEISKENSRRKPRDLAQRDGNGSNTVLRTCNGVEAHNVKNAPGSSSLGYCNGPSLATCEQLRDDAKRLRASWASSSSISGSQVTSPDQLISLQRRISTLEAALQANEAVASLSLSFHQDAPESVSPTRCLWQDHLRKLSSPSTPFYAGGPLGQGRPGRSRSPEILRLKNR